MSETENKLVTLDELIESKDRAKIVVKNRIPFTHKVVMIDNIIESCVSEDEYGMKRINYPLLKLSKEYSIVKTYSNIDLAVETSIVEAYEKLEENKIIENVISLICQDDIDFIDCMIDEEIRQIQTIDNSVSSVVAKALNKIVNKLPNNKDISKLIKDLPKTINKINPDKLKFVKDAISFNNGVGQ